MAKTKLTPDQLKRIHMALDQCEGQLSPAAALLGITRESLKKLIKDYPELSSYVDGATPPTEAETIARPALPVATKEETDLVEATRKADEQVQQGFEAIGVKGEALTEAMAFREFGKHHFIDMRHFIGGGVAKLFADLVADVKSVRNEIDDPSNKVDAEIQRMLREDRSRLVKLALDTYDRVRQATLDAAMIEAKRKEAKDGKKRAQPAFSPLAVKCDTLVVNEQPKPVSSESGQVKTSDRPNLVSVGP